ncbi:sensor histidine kinase [Mycobacterium montefiorense]|uniref:Anti-sigma regulatory factor n=2 Tax=Mycobacterium montefiorense TaxID=154654 RepID=A0AA37PM94_9MYCO|nr:sensor histidine kinase [Mycobacterium montefiorense]GKU37249.1 anti-sigma regulatory factor [Mycobacterium montefiorense]GKU43234.1 anti-sigma regulatory factor [Mycobacterium montefiorense]GKU44032.1 anti-sigma regulatory factor [Mycobacterium montefiorense]GKU61524.1 anti-sigma regulatory factor [Mycobacterium montefiorense]GKU66678.1 anti-sigma regulatory factor [Mycobacterium montefiorense]
MMESGSAEMIRGTESGHQGFVHSALLYHSQREYLDAVVPFVLEGLAMDEPVLVAVPGEYLASLRDALGGEGTTSGLQLVDIAEAARNPSRLLALEGSFVEENANRRARIVSQVFWPERSADESLACMQHEALVNSAFEGRRVTALCLYDAKRLDNDVLASAGMTHPLLWKSGSLQHSDEYAPDEVLAQCNRPLPVNPGAVTYMVRKSADLRPARSFAVNYAGWVGLSQDGIEDLQLVATELATNSLMYTDGACRLAFWRDDDHLVCEARDSGRLDDPLVGRLDPGPTGPASRGLFLVNAISDLVRTHTASTGTTIQAYLRLDSPAGPIS